MKKRNYRYLLFACLLMYSYYFFGIGDYLLARSFSDFDYPLSIDIKPLVNQVMSGQKASVAPINYYPYRFLSNSGKCRTIDKLDLLIVVKSAMENFRQRDAIRNTYGQENSIPGRIIKILFFLGIGELKSELQEKIDSEMALYKDIIQIDFQDNYYNNTIKTMMSFRWVYEHCSTADFYLFTDDDMYISVYNLLDYVEYKATNSNNNMFIGYVFESTPLRFKNSKWRVSVEEYPWNKWPPYVTAGAYVVNNKSMKILYIGSLFVKHFRFDDIYLGIVAKKVGIVPTHCNQFHFYKKRYSKEGYKDVIASHGYADHDELIRVWNEQNAFNL